MPKVWALVSCQESWAFLSGFWQRGWASTGLGRWSGVSSLRGYLSLCSTLAIRQGWIEKVCVVSVTTSVAASARAVQAENCEVSRVELGVETTAGRKSFLTAAVVRQGQPMHSPTQSSVLKGLVLPRLRAESARLGRGTRDLGGKKVRRRKEISDEILVVVLVAKVISSVIPWWCKQDESSQTEGLVEGLVEARMVVHESGRSEPPVNSRSEAYNEMQRNYKVLEAIVDRVLAMPRSPEVGSSNQASPSGSVGIAVASASEGVDIRVGVPLARMNILTEVKLAELQTNYSVPPYVGLRLPIAADVVRYPPEGSVMIFRDMYQHGFKLPLHPWVQMMLAKLGYAPGQYNPNFWLLLHGVYIAWWLVGLGEPTFEQFMYLYSISKQQGSFGWVQANCRKAKERGYFIGHKPST
ncbi:unnamed protein product [Prunus armeniaca]